jgi:flagellar protein FlaJ
MKQLIVSRISFKKIMGGEDFKQNVIYLVTSVSVGICLLCLVLTLLGVITTPLSPVDFIVFAFLCLTGFFGMYKFLEARKRFIMDTIFPDFVRDIAESRRAGMTFTKAILFASKGNYGTLTPEIQKISQQISWGTNVTDALIDFARRVNTKSIKRTVTLIIEASKSGGNVADVLDLASRDAREIQMLESERKANMNSYVVVIYVGMFVFLAIITILCTSFIPVMTGSSAAGLAGSLGGKSNFVKQEEINNIFYFATLIQGLGSGIVAGVFENGKFISSVKHMFVLVLIIWIAFKVLL